MSQYYGELKKLLSSNLDSQQLYYMLSAMDIPITSKVMCCLAHNGWNGSKREEGRKILEDIAIFGLYAFPAGQIFLEQFGGLKIIGGKHPEWQSRLPQDFQYCIRIPSSIELCRIGFWEVVQQSKDELIIPIAREHRYWDTLDIYWGESGKVYYSCEDYVGNMASNLVSYFAQVFGFEKSLNKSEWCEESFVDYARYEEIENQVNQGCYVSYAQKRFAQTGGVPNPITASDEFTKWLLSIT